MAATMIVIAVLAVCILLGRWTKLRVEKMGYRSMEEIADDELRTNAVEGKKGSGDASKEEEGKNDTEVV